MNEQTLQKSLVALAATSLVAVLILLTSAMTPPPRAVLAQGQDCSKKVETPRLHHDPLKVLLRGILL